MRSPIVFTDLDGTLLDHATYSWEPALPALRLLRERQIPLVFCSSKTRTEIEHYRRELDNHDPFISENGGGIFIPGGYFDLSVLPSEPVITKTAGWEIIRLGAPYHRLRRAIRRLREEGFTLTGFGDMTVAEIAALTGLTPEQSAMARERDFDEPFIFNGDRAGIERLRERVRAMGLQLTMGAFPHLLGGSNKGVAFEMLASLYRAKLGEIVTIALGDSLNDLPMLQCADQPVIIRTPEGRRHSALAVPNAIITRGEGPQGWNEAILKLLGTPSS